MYKNVHGKGRCLTGAAKEYEKAVEYWAWSNLRSVKEARKFCSLKPLISIVILLRMPPENFWTLAKTVKTIDASNRLKQSLDQIAKLCEINDSHFWHVSIQKVPTIGESHLDIFAQTHSMWDAEIT